MAIEFGKKTMIYAGVGVLVVVAAGAGAWFFLFEEDPPPAKVAATSPAKPAADAAKGAPAAAKPAAEAPKAAADDGKPAAKPSAKPAAAKPIPSDPNKLIAEVIEIAGPRAYFQTFAREAMLTAAAGAGEDAKPRDLSAAEVKAVVEAVERVFEPGKINAELAASLKGGFEVERMGRFLELLRQPISLKLTSEVLRNVAPETMKEQVENLRKNPPAAERLKLIQALDEVTLTSEVGADMTGAMARDMVDAMLAAMQKASKNVPKETRQMLGTQLNSMRAQARGQIRTIMTVMYRSATEEELGEYLKLLDADTGRWGSGLLANALRPAIVSRGSALGREAAQLAMAGKPGALAKPKAPAAPQPVAGAEMEKPAEKAAEKPAAPAVPAEAPGYRRAANIRELYARYNDLITATVMRDRAAVKELLDDGKSPNARQKDGMTPLMIAAGNGDADLAQMLLAKGADLNVRTPGGMTALSLAKERRRADLVQLLERHGAKN